MGASYSYRETLACAPPKSPSTGIAHQEVFENELALATVKWSAALATGQSLVRQTLIGFNTHELVLRAAVRAIEQRCSGNGMRMLGLRLAQYTSVSSVRQCWRAVETVATCGSLLAR